MNKAFNKFQKITRKAHKFIEPVSQTEDIDKLHPFEERNVHPEIDNITRKLFDDGHYSQATFEAFKFLDKEVQKISEVNKSGYNLMMKAFNVDSPKIKLTDLSNISEKDEQKGYMFLFSGAVLAIRNPRGHEFDIHETPDQCLDYISLASLLLRCLDEASQ